MVSVPLHIQKDRLPHSQKNLVKQSINRAILQQLSWQNLSLWEECSTQPERTQQCMAKSHTHTHAHWHGSPFVCTYPTGIPARVWNAERKRLSTVHRLQQRPGHDPLTGLGEQILAHPHSRIRHCHQNNEEARRRGKAGCARHTVKWGWSSAARPWAPQKGQRTPQRTLGVDRPPCNTPGELSQAHSITQAQLWNHASSLSEKNQVLTKSNHWKYKSSGNERV